MLFPSEALIEARRDLFQQMEAGTLTEEQVFQRALEMDEHDAIALTSLALARSAVGDLTTAEQYCWRAMVANPYLYDPCFRLSGMLSQRGESEMLCTAIMELGLRKLLHSKDGVEEIAKRAKHNAPGQPPHTRADLQATADAFLATLDAEPEEVTQRLDPFRLIEALVENASHGFDTDFVKALVDEGVDFIPHLLGVLRAMANNIMPEEDRSAAVASTALLGEIGSLDPLPELLECVMTDDEEIMEAAAWAVGRIAERQPKATFQALRKFAAATDAQQRCAIAFLVGHVPEELPAKLELLTSLLQGLEAFTRDDRHQLFMAVAEALLFLPGRRGQELAQSLLNRHAALLPRSVKAELRKLQDTVASLDELRKAEMPQLTIYDFCGGDGGEDEEEDEDEDDLVPEPVVRTPRPGRNDPCWCGSGKKYKKCHLEADENASHEPEAAKQPAGPEQERKRIANGLRERLLAFASEVVPKRELTAAMDEFFGGRPAEKDEQEAAMAEFFSWLIHDYLLPRNRQSPLQEFLKRHSGGLTARQRTILEGWSRSRYSLYEVQDIERGVGLLFNDMLVGGGTFVHDVSISNVATRWDCFVGRMEEAGDRMELDGILRLVPRPEVPALIAWAQTARERSGLDWDAFLRANSYKLRQKAVETTEDPGLPQVLSAEGDAIVFCKAIYNVVDETALRQALDTAEDLVADTDGYGWLEPGEIETGGRRVLGHVSIQSGRLTLECSTRQRLVRGKSMLRQLAGAALRHKADEQKGLEAAMREARTSPPPPPSEIPPEVERELVQKVLSAHYKKWPDMPLPALDGKTPRQAALQPNGRVRLIELLKMMENGEERNRQNGRPWFDLTPIKAELGIEF